MGKLQMLSLMRTQLAQVKASIENAIGAELKALKEKQAKLERFIQVHE